MAAKWATAAVAAFAAAAAAATAGATAGQPPVRRPAASAHATHERIVAVCDHAPADDAMPLIKGYVLPDVNKQLVVVDARDARHMHAIKNCDVDIVLPAGHDGYLMKVTDAVGLPSADIAVHPLAASQMVVVDVPAKDLPAFAAVLGERERLRPLRPHRPRRHAPLKLADAGKAARATKEDVVAALDADEFDTVMRRLTGEEPAPVGGSEVTINTRYTLSPQNAQAAQYILEYLQAAGYEDVFYHEFRYSSTTTQNIVAVKLGATYPDEIVVYGAHMDSTSGSPTTSAPGCIDNGSGTGAVMVTARAFANVTTDRTIYFMLFGAEEQGLIGSEVFVEEFYETGELNVVSALTMDMIGYSNRYHGVLIEGTTDPDIMELMDGMEENCRLFAPNLTVEKAYYSYGSDHVSFQRAGIPAFLSIEQDNTDYPGYHSTNDRYSYLSVEQSMDITRGMTGLLYDVAGGH